jgi:hypothetical protein
MVGRMLKIRNRNYSQWAGRHKLFDRERDSDVVRKNSLRRISAKRNAVTLLPRLTHTNGP